MWPKPCAPTRCRMTSTVSMAAAASPGHSCATCLVLLGKQEQGQTTWRERERERLFEGLGREERERWRVQRHVKTDRVEEIKKNTIGQAGNKLKGISMMLSGNSDVE